MLAAGPTNQSAFRFLNDKEENKLSASRRLKKIKTTS
jgi:hypothetical protein